MLNIHFVKTATLMAVLFSVHAVFADELEDRVQNLERTVNSRGLSQVEMQQQMDSLTNQVRTLQGQLDETNHQLQQAIDRQKALYQELDKLSQGAQQNQQGQQPPAAPASGDTGASAQPSATPQPQSPATPQPQPASAASDDTGVATVPAGASENQEYNNAVNLVLKQRQYDLAIASFNQFVAQHPSSSLAPGAYYWLGQLYMNKGNQDQARENFLSVAQKFKNSPKRPEAIYKLGVIAKSQGDTDKANKFFELVIKQYPSSAAAQLAKKAMNG